jgi:SAM-dependent methyltransferase
LHDTALISGEAFFRCYGKPGNSILDVGSMDVNGTLRNVWRPEDTTYFGIDQSVGPGVDHVVIPHTHWNFDPSAFDLVISSSCLEHDPLFWITFTQMARLCKPGGFIYVSVPVNGPYHGHPGDCYRFYKDSAPALAYWSTLCSFSLELIEHLFMAPQRDIWIDHVMVFGRGMFSMPEVKIRDHLPKEMILNG